MSMIKRTTSTSISGQQSDTASMGCSCNYAKRNYNGSRGFDWWFVNVEINFHLVIDTNVVYVDNDVFVRPLHGIHLLCYYWPSPKAKGLPVPPITLEICSRVSLFSHQLKSDFPNQLDPVCSAFIVSTTITTYTTTNIPTYWLLISRWYSVYEDEHVPRNNASISNDTSPLSVSTESKTKSKSDRTNTDIY